MSNVIKSTSLSTNLVMKTEMLPGSLKAQPCTQADFS